MPLRYYAGCQFGLELRFIAAVEQVIQQIIEAPDRWPVLEEDIPEVLPASFLMQCFTRLKSITY